MDGELLEVDWIFKVTGWFVPEFNEVGRFDVFPELGEAIVVEVVEHIPQ